ncbi:MAG: AAA family ATPase [Clostridia bacterium]|nr:AAA family ATPase [Clostridia bacterium]
MNKINKLIIENFQSHENTTLDFTKGLNVIIGPSDQGKSAVIRAIRWVLFNEPRGTDFIRQGALMARVAVEMNNGYTVVRERSKSKNKYTVINPDGNTMVLEGFGNDVPDEVVKAHGIPLVFLDNGINSSLNIGGQLEGPFLVSESAAVRAKAIGRLTGVHVIDKAIRDCIIDLRRESQSSERVSKEINDVSVKLESYGGLAYLEEALDSSRVTIGRLESLIKNNENLIAHKNNYELLSAEYYKVNLLLKKLVELDKCELAIKSCEADILKFNVLKRAKIVLDNVQSEIVHTVKVMHKTENIDKGYILLDDIKNKLTKLNKIIYYNGLKQSVIKELEHISSTIEQTRNIKSVVDTAASIEEKVSKIKILVDIQRKLEIINQDIEKGKYYLIKYKNVEMCEEQLTDIHKKKELLQKLEEAKRQYQINTNFILEGNKYIQNNKNDIANFIKEYIDLLKKVGKCPLCNSEISGIKIKEIIKEYEEVN